MAKHKKPRIKKKQAGALKGMTVGELRKLLANMPADTPVARLAYGRVIPIERPEIIMFNREKFEQNVAQFGGDQYASWPTLPLHTEDTDDIALIMIMNC